MLTDVKSWLKTTNLEVEEVLFTNPPGLPYIIFTDKTYHRGSDDKNCIADRYISIELYSETINTEVETKIENVLNEKAIEFSKDCTWIQEELFFQTVYDFNLIEKI